MKEKKLYGKCLKRKSKRKREKKRSDYYDGIKKIHVY